MRLFLRRLITLGAVFAVAVMATLISGTPAHAASKGSLQKYCSGFTQSSDGHTVTAVCNTPGSSYYFQAYFCNQGGCRWISSAWTPDRKRASISVGSAYLSGIGATVYYR